MGGFISPADQFTVLSAVILQHVLLLLLLLLSRGVVSPLVRARLSRAGSAAVTAAVVTCPALPPLQGRGGAGRAV